MRLRPPVILGIVLGLAAALLVIGYAAHNSEPKTMLADFGGPIRAVVMQYTRGSQFVAPVFHDYLQWQSPNLSIYLACPENEDLQEITALLGATASHLHIIPVFTHHEMTAWSRDRWVALIGNKTQSVTLLSPQGEASQEVWHERAGDSHVGEDLARSLPGVFLARRSPLYFDGGDLLADHGRVFVTRAVLERNLQHTVETRADLIPALTRELGAAPILMDNSPDHHAGMFMMSAGVDADGKPLMVVADPSLGKTVYNASPETDALFEKGPDFSSETQQRFDSVADLASQNGYRVVRIPVVPGHGIKYMTYVNVLLDRQSAQPIVYMSSYQGQPRMNDTAAAVWTSLGYQVRPVDCTTVWQRGGTLHCLVNVFRRDP